MHNPKRISIITVVLENQAYLRDAIESVLMQDYPHLEYIVIDGGSKDGSLDIIHSYGSRIHKVVSEPDEGIYDALNKGISMATGDIIGFLHSDDFYADSSVISHIAAAFDEQTDAVYADLDYVSLQDKLHVVRKWRSGPYQKNSFYKGWMPPHPTFFVRKAIYEQYGRCDTRMKSAADYELMLRLILKYQVRLKYIP